MTCHCVLVGFDKCMGDYRCKKYICVKHRYIDQIEQTPCPECEEE
jgi:hypothetical protein